MLGCEYFCIGSRLRMHYSGKFLVRMSHCPTSWWICTALFLSSTVPALSCPRYFLRIIFVDWPKWLFTNSSTPELRLVLDTSGHLRITCPSSSLTSWPIFLQPGHIFHCLPYLFCMRFPNRRFPDLAMFRTILLMHPLLSVKTANVVYFCTPAYIKFITIVFIRICTRFLVTIWKHSYFVTNHKNCLKENVFWQNGCKQSTQSLKNINF